LEMLVIKFIASSHEASTNPVPFLIKGRVSRS
jgi:hypothetical protein